MSIHAKESCYNCENTCKNTHVNPCDDCVEMKNSRAERIRAMTDEELASFLEEIYQRGQTGSYPPCGWSEWLRQQAEEQDILRRK